MFTAGLALTLATACSPLTVIDRFVPETGYEREADIPYGAEPRQKLDVYQPVAGRRSQAVIVFLYGGSWRKGDRKSYRFVGQMLASQGYLVVIPDYRLYPEVTFPGFVEDSASALAWVHRNIASRGGDPEKIVVIGHSAGAHNAALLALDRRYLKNAGVPYGSLAGWVGISGPYAFDPRKFSRIRPIFATAQPPESARPITLVGAGAPPAMLIHGEQDWTVSITNSIELTKRLQAVGGTVHYKALPDTGHTDILLGLAEPFKSDSPLVAHIANFVGTLDGKAVARSPRHSTSSSMSATR